MQNPKQHSTSPQATPAADTNPDPLTGASGAHPVGVTAGGVGGGVVGAVVGSAVAGPIGAVVGAVAGTVAGGLAGKEMGEMVNPTEEHKYWSSEYQKRPYYKAGTAYGQYSPAYQYGWESRAANQGKSFEESEEQLARDWDKRRGASSLSWSDAKQATQDAWERNHGARNSPAKSPR